MAMTLVRELKGVLRQVAVAAKLPEGAELTVRLEPTVRQLQQKAQAWDRLMDLCGSTRDGSDTLVTLGQDDATHTCHVKVHGGHTLIARSFIGALELVEAVGEDSAARTIVDPGC